MTTGKLIDYFEPQAAPHPSAAVAMLAVSRWPDGSTPLVVIELLTEAHATAFAKAVRDAEQGLGYQLNGAPNVAMSEDIADRLWTASGRTLRNPEERAHLLDNGAAWADLGTVRKLV